MIGLRFAQDLRLALFRAGFFAVFFLHGAIVLPHIGPLGLASA